MSACVFIGPTLSVDQARLLAPDLQYLPPASHTSIVDAVRQFNPSLIGIIDGYFRQHPSVWHKEILWAMDQGIGVMGAASMGALRAAELSAFGMIGIGEVFKAFAAGALPPFDGLTDDDEVAVLHGPADSGFLAASDAMVNIRATLQRAHAAHVVTADEQATLTRLAKARHFTERRYRTLLDDARVQSLSTTMVDRLADWLPAHRIDQKRLDAEALIMCVATLCQEADSPARQRTVTSGSHHGIAGDAWIDRSVVPPLDPPFEMTELFAEVLATHEAEHRHPQREGRAGLTNDEQAVLSALRNDKQHYQHVLTEALLLQALLEGVDGVAPSGDAMRSCADQFRRQRGLLDRPGVDRWLQDHDQSPADFDVLISHAVTLQEHLETSPSPAVQQLILERLRLRDVYADLLTK